MQTDSSNTKICPRCGKANNAAYSYCNECGAPLLENSGAYGSPSGGYNPYYRSASPESPPDLNVNFNGVTASDMYDYTRHNSAFYLKLQRLKLTNTNILWCWPLFFLGIFLGFYGIGAYMLYKKLYKPGFVIMAVGAVHNMVGYFRIVEMYKEMAGIIEKAQSISGDEQLKSLLTSLYSVEGNASFNALNATLTLLSAVLSVAFAMFFYNIYINVSSKRILKMKSLNPQVSCFKIGGSNLALAIAIPAALTALYIAFSVIAFNPIMTKLTEIIFSQSAL